MNGCGRRRARGHGSAAGSGATRAPAMGFPVSASSTNPVIAGPSPGAGGGSFASSSTMRVGSRGPREAEVGEASRAAGAARSAAGRSSERIVRASGPGRPTDAGGRYAPASAARTRTRRGRFFRIGRFATPSETSGARTRRGGGTRSWSRGRGPRRRTRNPRMATRAARRARSAAARSGRHARGDCARADGPRRDVAPTIPPWDQKVDEAVRPAAPVAPLSSGARRSRRARPATWRPTPCGAPRRQGRVHAEPEHAVSHGVHAGPRSRDPRVGVPPARVQDAGLRQPRGRRLSHAV